MSVELLAHAQAARKNAAALRRGVGSRVDKPAIEARAQADGHDLRAELLTVAARLSVAVANPDDARSVAFLVLDRFGLGPDSDCSEHRGDKLWTQSDEYLARRALHEVAKAGE